MLQTFFFPSLSKTPLQPSTSNSTLPPEPRSHHQHNLCTTWQHGKHRKPGEEGLTFHVRTRKALCSRQRSPAADVGCRFPVWSQLQAGSAAAKCGSVELSRVIGHATDHQRSTVSPQQPSLAQNSHSKHFRSRWQDRKGREMQGLCFVTNAGLCIQQSKLDLDHRIIAVGRDL